MPSPSMTRRSHWLACRRRRPAVSSAIDSKAVISRPWSGRAELRQHHLPVHRFAQRRGAESPHHTAASPIALS